jgi:hypothetical protein
MSDDRCPTCGRPYGPPPKRICTVCGKQITKSHKWQIVDGRIQHRFCNNPMGYTDKESAPPSGQCGAAHNLRPSRPPVGERKVGK